MARGHGGNVWKLAAERGCEPGDILDFSANINPLGPPEWLRPLVSRRLESVVHYPDPAASDLVEALARRHGVDPNTIVAGNGASEILFALPRVLDAARAVVPVPSYIDYARAARLGGLDVESLPLAESREFALDLPALEERLRGDEAVVLGQPNNPTGLVVDPDELRQCAVRDPGTTFVVDEAFLDLVEECDTLIRGRPANVVVLCSMTKTYAIPGLRLGYAVAEAETISRLRQALAPWSVNVLAQAVGAAAIRDEDYLQRTRAYVSEQREQLRGELSRVPELTVYPGRANFLLVRIDRGDADANALADTLLSEGIAIRVCDNYEGLDARFFRVAVRTADENERLCRAVRSALGQPARRSARKRTPAIMFQGTSSNAGKSVLAAALCRILLQDGVRVAPFKAQNLSLNSFVTRDGCEMGRAQVMQAQACRLDPDVRMNPVLLKPSSDTGMQVIVRGKPLTGLDALDDRERCDKLFAHVKACYDSLASEHDAMVLEGAGSPGEVNLKSRDIVNMRMAKYAGAPVLLVGDIDRGGVFASFVGTMEVLAEWERRRVAGFVVNRFRGHEALLGNAFEIVEQHTGRRVLGVVPYLDRLNLPEEDAVEFKDGAFDDSGAVAECVTLGVVDLPHISNCTDLDALRLEPDVRVRVVREPSDLTDMDAVVIPGSKNVLRDLEWLKTSGLAEAIGRLAASGASEIIGICGGFQMLGDTMSDPHHVESSTGEDTGLGLLRVKTELGREKTLCRVECRHGPSGLDVFGYEIHHGRTDPGPEQPILKRGDGEIIGVSSADGRVWGTYLHGVFDADEFRRWFIDGLRRRQGLAPLGEVVATYDLEPAFDRLADVVRAALDMDAVYRLIGL